MAKKQTARPSKGGNARKSRGATNGKPKSRGATNGPDFGPPIIADPPYREAAPEFDAEAFAAAIIVKLKGDVLTDVTRMALRLADAGDRLSIVTADAGFLIQRYLIDSIKAGEGVPGTLQETAELISGPAEAEELKTAQGQVRTLLELLRPFADAYAVAAPKRSDKCRRVRIVDDYNAKQLTGLDFQCFEIAAAAFSKGIPTHVPPSGTLQGVAQRIANRIHDVGCWSPDFLAGLIESEISSELTEGLGKVQEITARAAELGAETEQQQQLAAQKLEEAERKAAALANALRPFAIAWKEHTSGRNSLDHTAADHFRNAAHAYVANGGSIAERDPVPLGPNRELTGPVAEGLAQAIRHAGVAAAELGYDPKQEPSLLNWFINQSKKANVLNSKLVEIYRNVFGNIARECLRQGRTSKPEDDMATADKIVEATLSIWNLSGPVEFDGATIERERDAFKAEAADLQRQADEHSAWALKIGGAIGKLTNAAILRGYDPNGTDLGVFEFATKGLEELGNFREAFRQHGLSTDDPVATIETMKEVMRTAGRNFNLYQAAHSHRSELLARAFDLLNIVKAANLPLEDKTSQALRNLAAVVTKVQRMNKDEPPFKHGERVEFIPEHKTGRVSDCFLDNRWAPELGLWYVRVRIEGPAAEGDPNGMKQSLQLRADECRLLIP